jgi:hypothetical protein
MEVPVTAALVAGNRPNEVVLGTWKIQIRPPRVWGRPRGSRSLYVPKLANNNPLIGARRQEDADGRGGANELDLVLERIDDEFGATREAKLVIVAIFALPHLRSVAVAQVALAEGEGDVSS